MVVELGIYIYKRTYVWFSPLGERNHAATDMATTMTRPTKTLYL